MGGKLREGGFRSHRVAERAGRHALEDFLNGHNAWNENCSMAAHRARTRAVPS